MKNSVDFNDDEPDRNKDNAHEHSMDTTQNDGGSVADSTIPTKDGKVAAPIEPKQIDSASTLESNQTNESNSEINKKSGKKYAGVIYKHAPLFLSMYFEKDILYKKLSCHKINKTLLDYGGEPMQVMNQSRNALLIKCKNAKQSIEYQKINQIEDYFVNTKPHPTLNQCKGKIHAPELAASTVEELKEDLSQQGVTYIYQLKRKVKDSNELENTNTFILTFNTPTLPFTIKTSYLCLEVRPHVEYPRRCQNCLLYGHSKTKCRRAISRCYQCGQDKTEEHINPCILPKNCFHCSSEHVVSYKGCQRYKLETEILHVASNLKISLLEASKIVKASGKFNNKTYADATKQVPNSSLGKNQLPLNNTMNASTNNTFNVLKDHVPANNDNSLKIIANQNTSNQKQINKNATSTFREEKNTRIASQNLNASSNNKTNFKRERSTTNMNVVKTKIHRSQEATSSKGNQNTATPSLIHSYPMPPDYNKNPNGNNYKPRQNPNSNLPKEKLYSVSEFKHSPPRDPRKKPQTGQSIKTVIGSTSQRNPNL